MKGRIVTHKVCRRRACALCEPIREPSPSSPRTVRRRAVGCSERPCQCRWRPCAKGAGGIATSAHGRVDGGVEPMIATHTHSGCRTGKSDRVAIPTFLRESKACLSTNFEEKTGVVGWNAEVQKPWRWTSMAGDLHCMPPHQRQGKTERELPFPQGPTPLAAKERRSLGPLMISLSYARACASKHGCGANTQHKDHKFGRESIFSVDTRL